MEQDDEEFEKLLGEIPRATSTPPHPEELQRALTVQLNDGSFLNVKDEVMQAVTETGAEKMYQDIYRPLSGAATSPQSNDQRAYNDPPIIPPILAHNQLPSFYSGSALDSACPSYRLGQLELQQKQETEIDSHHSSQGQLLKPSNSGVDITKASPEQILSNEQSLSSALANLNFEDSSIVETDTQAHVEEGASNAFLERGTTTGLTSESDSVASSGLYSHLNASGFGSAFEASLESRLPGSIPSLDPFSQNASPTRESLNNGFHTGFSQLPMQPVGHAIQKWPVQRSPGIDLVCNGQSSWGSYNPEYFSNHHLQQQQGNFGAYTEDAPAPTHTACGYPNANGNDVFSPYTSYESQYLSNMEIGSFVQAQHMQEAAAVRAHQQMEERMRYRSRMQQEFFLRQQQLQDQQARFYASLQGQPGALASTYTRVSPEAQLCQRPSPGSSLAVSFLHQQHLPKPTMTGRITLDGGWKDQQSQSVWAAPMVVPPDNSQTSPAGNVCRYFAQGFCSRGETCPFMHFQAHSGSSNHLSLNGAVDASFQARAFSGKAPSRKSISNGHALPGELVVGPGTRKKVNAHCNGHMFSNASHVRALERLGGANGDSKVSSKVGTEKSLDLETLHSLKAEHHLPQQQQQQQPRYTTLEEVEGRIYSIAKDQHGCRFLQRKFEEGAPEDIQKIFIQIIDHITELMTDPFGNYLVQKLLEVCDENERMEILRRVTGKGQLVTIALNMHGTRAVQKLIETLESSEQVAMVKSSLRQGVVTLIKDLNGNHVVQRCLQRLSNEDSQFIFDAAALHCVEIATHRHGCCVLQRCVDYSSGHQRERLVAEIAANALVLSQNPFGNYVVQYVLDLGIPEAMMEVVNCLKGSYAHLAVQKFSSNVVEKCLKLAGEDSKALIVRELMTSPRLGQLLQDPYANYVIQSALTVSKGSLHAEFVEAIRPHLAAVRSSPYGKRILSRTNLKK